MLPYRKLPLRTVSFHVQKTLNGVLIEGSHIVKIPITCNREILYGENPHGKNPYMEKFYGFVKGQKKSFYSERSEAEGWAERGIGLVKKKMNKKKRNHDYDDDDYDDDDQFCTRSNILPFFFQIFTLMFLLFTPKSIYGLYYVPTLCKRHPD